MRITYASGKTMDGIVLLKHDNCIRVAVPCCEDVVEFTAENGKWSSEDWEPVLLEFAWDRHSHRDVVSEADCICPRRLASILIQLLLSGSEDHYVDRPKALSVGASCC